MKAIHFLQGLSFFLAVLFGAAEGKTCHSASECNPNECCVTRSSYIGGCRSRACEGCTCLPESIKSGLGDMYLGSCPCQEGLVCVPAAVIENQEERTVEYLNSTCQTKEVLLNLYTRLLKSQGFNPRLLPSFMYSNKRYFKGKM